MDDTNHAQASGKEIVTCCHDWKDGLVMIRADKHRLLSSNSNIIIKVNNEAGVKFGSAVTASEAANQRYAHVRFQSSHPGVAIPQVFRYTEMTMTDGRTG